MATLKSDLIRQSLAKLAITGYDYDIDPEEVDTALIELETMMTEWDGQGIRVSFTLAVSPEEALASQPAGSYDWARNAIVCNLAVRLAPNYGKQVPPELALNAAQSMSRILTATPVLPEVQYTARMPRGSGNTLRGRQLSRFYRPDEYITVENGGELDGLVE